MRGRECKREWKRMREWTVCEHDRTWNGCIARANSGITTGNYIVRWRWSIPHAAHSLLHITLIYLAGVGRWMKGLLLLLFAIWAIDNRAHYRLTNTPSTQCIRPARATIHPVQSRCVCAYRPGRALVSVYPKYKIKHTNDFCKVGYLVAVNS